MRVLRLKDVKERTGLSHSTIYRLIAANKFPKNIKLSSNSVGWIDTEIHSWITEKINERDELPYETNSQKA